MSGFVDADLRQFFDTIEQEKLIDLIAEEISDGRVLQLVRDMLRAGVMEEGRLATHADRRAPGWGGQSAVVQRLPDAVGPPDGRGGLPAHALGGRLRRADVRRGKRPSGPWPSPRGFSGRNWGSSCIRRRRELCTSAKASSSWATR